MSPLSPEWFKEFLFDRTIFAVAALALLATVTMFWLLLRAKREHMTDLRLILPLADKLSELNEESLQLLERLSERRRGRREPPSSENT